MQSTYNLVLVAEKAVEGIFCDHYSARWNTDTTTSTDPQENRVLTASILDQLQQFVQHHTESGGSNTMADSQDRANLEHGIAMTSTTQIHGFTGLGII